MNKTTDQSEKMDRMYRYQRYFYDLTRKYYLLGRDALIREMDVKPGDRILEMGCGTARNLILLGKMHPDIELYGLDASEEMLKTAEKMAVRAGMDHRIHLQPCLAEQLDYKKTFGLDAPFDSIFFSLFALHDSSLAGSHPNGAGQSEIRRSIRHR